MLSHFDWCYCDSHRQPVLAVGAAYNAHRFQIHQFFWGPIMSIGLDRKLFLCLVVVLFTFSAVPAAFAQQSPGLDKHARKIEKKLARLRAGSIVQIDLRNHSTSLGSLGSLSADTFQVTDSDNNKTETFAYNDVAQVHKAKEYIGEGSEPGRLHVPLPVLIAAGAVAAGAATYLAVR
jgi:hypothetical protein